MPLSKETEPIFYSSINYRQQVSAGLQGYIFTKMLLYIYEIISNINVFHPESINTNPSNYNELL